MKIIVAVQNRNAASIIGTAPVIARDELGT